MSRLIDTLRRGEFESRLSVIQHFYYSMENVLGNVALRRSPPRVDGAQLLNLGCGPYIFPGWVNADGYGVKRYLREPSFRPNWMLDITKPWRCDNDHWDGIFTEHVIEHVTYSDAVFVFEECLRTLKPGAWLRVSVPDLARYVGTYNGATANVPEMAFPHPALAIPYLTQMHLHVSSWDPSLMQTVLQDIGFVDVAARAYLEGADPRLLKDDKHKADQSLYVEGRKA